MTSPESKEPNVRNAGQCHNQVLKKVLKKLHHEALGKIIRLENWLLRSNWLFQFNHEILSGLDTRNVSQWVSNLSLSSTKRTERSTLTPKRRGEGLMTYLKSRLMLTMIAAIPILTTTMTDPEARRAPWAWSCNRFSPITPWPQWKKLWIRMWPECSSQVPDLPGFRATRK